VTPEPLLSVVIPVYRNESSIEMLVNELAALANRIDGPLQCVFVVDASPDTSRAELSRRLSNSTLSSIVVDHSRNFGSFAAIRTGLEYASGTYIGVMAADLQEPPELMDQFLAALQNSDVQVVVGERVSRTGDKISHRFAATTFWRMYRRFVLPSMPPGGVDVFACTSDVRDRILLFREANSSLVGLLVWLGFRMVSIPYNRQERADGGLSAWTFRKKVRYMMDSIYSFTDLPLRILRAIGLVGLFASLVVSVAVAIARWRGNIKVPGYTPLILALSVSTMLILSALGIVGSYVWRAYENTKQRPLSIVEKVERIEPR
jgi:polyisoprenyl-phosphate glycosyltransferase